MDEDGETGRKRSQLKAESEKLNKAVNSIEMLEQIYAREPDTTDSQCQSVEHSDGGSSQMEIDEHGI